jgi:hypothetical protein
MAEYNRGEDAAPEPQAASRCLHYSVGKTAFTVETAGESCAPRAFLIEWPTGAWRYRVWHQRSVIRRFATPTRLVDLGADTTGIGQDMRDSLRVEDEGERRLLRNTHDQAIWVEASVRQGPQQAKFCWVLPAQARKIFAVVYAGDPEPVLSIGLAEREHI